MNMKSKMNLTLGELIISADQTWGARRAAKIVRFMFQLGLVAFPRPVLCLVPAAKGRSE